MAFDLLVKGPVVDGLTEAEVADGAGGLVTVRATVPGTASFTERVQCFEYGQKLLGNLQRPSCEPCPTVHAVQLEDCSRSAGLWVGVVVGLDTHLPQLVQLVGHPLFRYRADYEPVKRLFRSHPCAIDPKQVIACSEVARVIRTTDG